MDKLKKITSKEYIKNLNNDNIDIAAAQIRSFLVSNVLKTGGHLASNLGVVELTLALHKVFDFPKDKIIFDVGHQSYVHKILSGRYDKFQTLRQFGGLSGFPKIQESEYDSFNTGHSSTSISAALGMARARDLTGDEYNIIAFIGDGAISNGMALEALNDAGVSNSKIIIILNDNEMSINENVGGLSLYLSMLRFNPKYIKVKSNMHKLFDKLGFTGRFLTNIFTKVKSIVKFATIKVTLFEQLGFKYIGLIDGYDIDELTEALEAARKSKKSVIVHTTTVKGKGYNDAEMNPSSYHGVSPKEKNVLPLCQSYTEIFKKFMIDKAASCDKLVSITAAMTSGCGLDDFKSMYPHRFFDVGIAEEHAVTTAAGMAINGMIPVFSVYSTFLQRAYDQILHDVCLQNLHVIFAIDRAGIVGEDGETHQGIFDFSYLLHIPNMTVLAPSCESEFLSMLNYAIDVAHGPVAIRYPKDYADDKHKFVFNTHGFNTVNLTGNDVVIISIGRMLSICEETVSLLNNDGINSVHLISIGMIKPLNTEYLNEVLSKSKIAVTVEDNIISGGAGEYIASKVNREYKSKIINIGFNDTFVQHGRQPELFDAYGISPENISKIIKKELIDQ